MVTVLSIHLIFSVAMIVVSSRGTIVNVGPRRHLSLILYCKLFMLLPEFAVTLLGEYDCCLHYNYRIYSHISIDSHALLPTSTSRCAVK